MVNWLEIRWDSEDNQLDQTISFIIRLDYIASVAMFESLNSSLIDICNEFNHRLFILLIFSIEIAVYLESP